MGIVKSAQTAATVAGIVAGVATSPVDHPSNTGKPREFGRHIVDSRADSNRANMDRETRTKGARSSENSSNK